MTWAANILTMFCTLKSRYLAWHPWVFHVKNIKYKSISTTENPLHIDFERYHHSAPFCRWMKFNYVWLIYFQKSLIFLVNVIKNWNRTWNKLLCLASSQTLRCVNFPSFICFSPRLLIRDIILFLTFISLFKKDAQSSQ